MSDATFSCPPLRPFSRRPARAVLGALALALAALGCGGSVDSRMAEVRALQDVGQFSASVDELREILAVSPDLPEANYRLGVALVQMGDPSRAVWALEKAAESDEYAVQASLLLASAHFANQNFEATVAAADRVLELDPDRLVALQVRAKGNLGAGKMEDALKDAERLLAAQPDDYDAHALRASILADMGRLDEAKKAHAELKELALASNDPSVAQRGCLAPAILARDQLKDMAAAESLFDDCVQRFPTSAFVAGEAMRFYDDVHKSDKALDLIRKAVAQAPENLSLRSTLAYRLAKDGEVDAAEKELLDAVESFKSAGAWNLLANFYRQQNQPQKALDALDKVIELSGGGTDQLRFQQADVLIDVGDLDRAEQVAGALHEPIYAKLIQGRLRLARGDAAGALAAFDEGIRAWPSNAGARYLAGVAARELGDWDRAVSELREAVRVDNQATAASELLVRVYYDRGDYPQVLTFSRMALRHKGGHPADVLVLTSRSLTQLGRYDEARGAVRLLKRIKGEGARAAIETAAIERAQSGPAAASASLEASGVDLLDPANEAVLRAWVDHELAADRASKALARVDAALARTPDHAAYLDLRGSILTSLDRGDEARAAFEKAVAQDPKDAAALAGLAALTARKGDLKGAIAQFDQASSLVPDQVAYAYSAAQLSLAAGDKEGAERRLRDIVRRAPSHAGAMNDLAWILAEQATDLDLALKLAQRAQQIDPSPEVLDTLGWVQHQRGDDAAAVATLQQAVDARPDSPSIRYRLGVALLKTGDQKRAKEMLEAAVEGGSFPEADAARRELAQLQPR